MEGAIRALLFLYAILAAIAAAIMITIAIGALYIFSLSLGKAAKFDFDEIFEVSVFVFFIQSLSMALGFFTLWMLSDDGSGSVFWLAIGAIASGLSWPVSLFFCLDSPAHSQMAVWATGAAIIISQSYVICRVVKKTQKSVSS